ncbi:ABC transporter permease [Chloroflexota bacterium]
MNKTALIGKHEFIQQIKSKGFIIFTLLFPIIGLSIIGISQIVQATGQSPENVDTLKIGYIDEIGEFDNYNSDSELITLVPYDTQTEATTALLSKDINEYFVIPADYLQSGLVTRYVTEKELETPGDLYWVIRAFLQQNMLDGQINTELIERVKYPLALRSIRLDASGDTATDQGGISTFFIPMIFGFLLIMSIASSSGSLLQSLGEEKDNRIMEILLSSISTQQLLIGKVIGIGIAALLQIIFWLISGFFMLRMASNTIGGFFTTIYTPDNMILLGIMYFILGYSLFSVISVGLGAIAANPKDTPQITMILTLTSILPFYIAIFFLKDNPDHVIGTIMTLFPLTAPMAVLVRLGISEIASWELALSLGLMVIGIIGSVILASKTFRIFLLMYGKTPRFKDIFRLLKES